MRRTSERPDGFTLVELLIVIVILGILAAVTVFAVRGITDQGDESACAVDRQTVEDAEEAHYGLHGEYAPEADLVATQLLRTVSINHDVTVDGGGGGYTITPVAACAGGSATTTTVAGSGGPTSLTWAGFPAESYGSGPLTFVMAGAGSLFPFGNSATEYEWTYVLLDPAPTGYRIIRVDTASAGDNLTIDQMDALLTAPMAGFVWHFSPVGSVMENDGVTVNSSFNAYIAANAVGPRCTASLSPGSDLAYCISVFTG
ncbi:MAG: type II secretion system protein [Actinobacteria bacterium]|nr:type II secretion system protein [Actinomycetota bacterium]